MAYYYDVAITKLLQDDNDMYKIKGYECTVTQGGSQVTGIENSFGARDWTADVILICTAEFDSGESKWVVSFDKSVDYTHEIGTQLIKDPNRGRRFRIYPSKMVTAGEAEVNFLLPETEGSYRISMDLLNVEGFTEVTTTESFEVNRFPLQHLLSSIEIKSKSYLTYFPGDSIELAADIRDIINQAVDADLEFTIKGEVQ